MTEYTKPEQFGIPDRMTDDKCPSKMTEASKVHPLANESFAPLFTDEAYLKRVRADFGLHMALRLAMERSIVSGAFENKSQVSGHRLQSGCLPPSHALVSSLTGEDLDFGFKDVLNPLEFSEVLRDPHSFGEADGKKKSNRQTSLVPDGII